jgi:hypothetical protein
MPGQGFMSGRNLNARTIQRTKNSKELLTHIKENKMTPEQERVMNSPARLPGNWKPIVSENISDIIYDENKKILYVRFHYGSRTYRYFFVPKTVYDRMMELSAGEARMTGRKEIKTDDNSVGHYFNNHVKKNSSPKSGWESSGMAYAFEELE